MKTLPRLTSPHTLVRLVFFLIILGWPLVYKNSYALSNMITAGIFAVMALSVNLIMGQAGQLSFGVAAFAGIGGYTVALTTVRLGWSPLVALVVGIILACAVALILGKPVLRLRLYFLAMATIALVTIFTVVVSTADSITFGETGVPGIPWLSLGGFEFDSFFKQYYFVWIVILALLVFSEAAMRSRVGRALRALSANEVAASTLGIDTAAWKLRTFVVSSAFAGLAGGLWAMFLTSAAPADFSLFTAITVVLMVLVGGMDSLLGSVLGAILIAWITFSLGHYQQYSGGIYAVVLIALALFLPGGIAGLLSRGWLHSAVMAPAQFLKATGAKRDLQSPHQELRRESHPDATSRVTDLKEESSLVASWDARDSRVDRADKVAVVGDLGSGDDRAIGSGRVNGRGSDSGRSVEEVLRLEDVTVEFGGLQALRHVSISTVAGSITSIIGPNGAGKTTLFNVISGLQRPNGGHVWYRREDLTRLRPYDVARLGVARTFQNLRIFENMTVLENVMVGRHRHEGSHFLTAGLRLPSQRREESQSRAFCHRILGIVGLQERADEMAASLPYGQQRLVEIARALATEPTLLLLDEPAAGMNASERGVLAERIVAIKESGIDVLLVEHDMKLVMGLSQYVGVLDHGNLICEGPPEQVQYHPAVIEAYLGASEDTERRPRIGHPERMAALSSKPAIERILEVEGLSTYYGAVAAVREVSLHVDASEVVAVLGANGAGKTTLLRTISGSLKAHTGRVLFEGRDITRLSPPRIVDQGICQVLEGRHVFPTLTVHDNLTLGAGKYHKGAGTGEELASVFELFPTLFERRGQMAGSLSGGEQQMLAIGRALMGRPRLLLLDEPSMGLAPIVAQAIFEALKILNDGGLALLMVEQNAEAALEIADRAIVLVTGEVALGGKAMDLREDPRLHDLYLGRNEVDNLD